MNAAATFLAVLLSWASPAPSFQIDEASIRAAFEKARAAVAAELKLDPVPSIPVRTSTKREIAEILTEELTAQARTQIDDPQAARRQARLSARVLTEGILAKYATVEGIILVSPDTFVHLASLIAEPGLVSEQALCATLAHECVHAFDAKRYDWPERLTKLKGFEAIQAYSAVLEGHAQRVARAACARGGWKEGFETFTRSIGKLPEEGDEATRLIARIIATTIASQYYDGERFIEAIERKGGEEAIARAFREPPPDMETIFHPEWFLDPASRPAVAYTVEAGLDAFASRFDEKIWMAQRVTATRPQLEAVLSLLPSEDLARILDHMERNRLIVLVPKDAPQSKMVTAGIYIFSSAEESAFYIAAAERLSRIKDEKMKDGVIRIVSSKHTPLRSPGWQGLVLEKTVEAGGLSFGVSSLVASRGALAVEILHSNEPITREALADLATEMLEKAAGGSPAEGDGPPATEPLESAGVFEVIELPFEGPRQGPADAPSRDIAFRVVFRHESGAPEYAVHGFWDGDGRGGVEGNVFKVRFCPTAPGRWILSEVRSSVRELDGQKQGRHVAAVASAHPGFWIPDADSPGGRWYRRSDGSHPYIVGNTHYSFLSGMRDGGRPSGNEIAKDIARNAEYFAKLRFTLHGDRYPHPRVKPFFDDEGKPTDDGDFSHRPNPAWFHERADVAVREAWKVDLIADLILAGPDTEDARATLRAARNGGDPTPYLRTIAARYGSYPNVWICLANEFNIKNPAYTEAEIARFGGIIRAHLPYPTPLSVHSSPPVVWPEAFDDLPPWNDHQIVQKKLRDLGSASDVIIRAWAGEDGAPRGKPTIDDELSYEGAGDKHIEADTIEAHLGAFLGGGYGSTGFKPGAKTGHYFWGGFDPAEHTSAGNLRFLRRVIDDGISFWRMAPGASIFEGLDDGFRAMAWPGNEYVLGTNRARRGIAANLPAGAWTVARHDIISEVSAVIAEKVSGRFRFDAPDSRAVLFHFKRTDIDDDGDDEEGDRADESYPPGIRAASRRPNILWLIAEDFGPHLGCYGTKEVRTPNLDALAAAGVRYTRFYTTAPVCSPSRSAFMTGMYATSLDAHNHRSHRGADSPNPLPDGVRLVTEWMRDAGYFTANIRTLPASCGFKGTGKTDWNFTIGGKPFDSADWADLRTHRPFFAQVNFQETHRAFHAPKNADPARVEMPPYEPDHPVAREDRAKYLDAATELDRKIGRILARLETDGLADDTVVIFFGDNGEATIRGKQFCYEEGLHVPLIIRWPKAMPAPAQVRAGGVDDRLLMAIDLAPTMLEIAGAKVPETMQGRPFLGDGAGPPREYVFGARDRCDMTIMRLRTVRDARYRYIRNFTPQVPFLARNEYKENSYPVWNLLKTLDADGKLAPAPAVLCRPSMPEEELYDLDADPHQIRNLAGRAEEAAALARMRDALDRWLAETGDRDRPMETLEEVARAERRFDPQKDWRPEPPEICPLKHGVWEPFPALSDEFDGDALDASKWHPRNPDWKGRKPGFFNPENVSVRDGMLLLQAKREDLPDLPPGYHTYTTAAVKGKTKVRYGYFEIRAQAMDSRASSAFWFYDPTPEIWSEIDVFEIGARAQPHRYYTNTHLFHTLVETVHWHKSRIWEAPYHLGREFHRYGFEWAPDALRYSVDGRVIREEANTHWHQPLTLNFDSETFPTWFGLPAEEELPATFRIDYLRAWKRKDGPPDDRIEACEFRFPGRTGPGETSCRLKVEGGGTLVVEATG
ncbi:MAG: sulfatase-like hydrolase/transferase, partial [Planctomycetes bacterium]|nr:sulfatase-like hydrolase/transferase [Planctomycetota bacterium]